MSDEFTAPHRGDQFNAKEHANELLLFFPTEYHEAVPTRFSEAGKPDPSAVTAHVVFLDGGSAGLVLHDTMIFGRFMVGQLKGGVGGKAVLGRLGQGQNTKGNPPWVILDPTDADVQAARGWFSANDDPRKGGFTAPPSPTPAPQATFSASTPTVTASPATLPVNGNNGAGADPQAVAKLVAKGLDPAAYTAEQISLLAATL